MYFQATARVRSYGYAKESLEVSNGQYAIRFECDATDRIERIRIRKRVPDYREHLPSVKQGPNGETTFDLGGGPHPDDLIDFLQHIESLGGFWCGIEKIFWESTEFEWIPENPEEKSLVEIPSFCISETVFLERREDVNLTRIFYAVAHRDKQKHLVLPLAFFREAENEYAANRYIYAFYNYYFFLEGLYGNGKTKNTLVLREFKSSADLTAAVQETIGEFTSGEMPIRHREMLQEYLGSAGCDLSVDGILRLIVTMRGSLHHFSPHGPQTKGTPQNQAWLETLALLMVSICAKLVPKLLFPPNLQGVAPH